MHIPKSLFGLREFLSNLDALEALDPLKLDLRDREDLYLLGLLPAETAPGFYERSSIKSN